MLMDDDAYARSADAMQQRLAQSNDRHQALVAIFVENAIVFGLYPDPESIMRWDKYIMKGADRITDQAPDNIACLWCRSIEEAMSMARTFGDGRRDQAK